MSKDRGSARDMLDTIGRDVGGDDLANRMKLARDGAIVRIDVANGLETWPPEGAYKLGLDYFAKEREDDAREAAQQVENAQRLAAATADLAAARERSGLNRERKAREQALADANA
jgi:hypothetical protein